MDDFSYYSTIASVLIIQISYYLLFKYDKKAEKLNYRQAKDSKLAIVLVTTKELNHSTLVPRLKGRLKKAGFSIYEICSFNSGGEHENENENEEQKVKENEGEKDKSNNEYLTQSSDLEEMIWVDFGARKNDRPNEAVKIIEAKLNSRKQQLYAYINLSASISLLSTSSPSSQFPSTSFTSSSSSSCEQMLLQPLIGNSLIPPLALLASFSGLIKREATRVISVRGSICSRGKEAEEEGAASGLIKVIQLLDEGVEQFLFGGGNKRLLSVLVRNSSHEQQKLGSFNEAIKRSQSFVVEKEGGQKINPNFCKQEENNLPVEMLVETLAKIVTLRYPDQREWIVSGRGQLEVKEKMEVK